MLHLPPYSHRYDLMAKVIGVGAGIAAMSPVSKALTWACAATGIEPVLRTHDDGIWMPAATELLCFLIAMLLAWRFLYRPLLVPAATWLFLKLARDTQISWSDSVALAPLVQLGKDAMWFPVPELPDMPEGHRVAYLYALAEKTNRLAPSARTNARYLHLPAETMPVVASMPVSAIDRHPELTRKVGRLPPRTVGLLMLALGGLLGYWGIVAPLQAMARHEQHIHYHYEATVAAPGILVIGILYTALGSRASGEYPSGCSSLVPCVSVRAFGPKTELDPVGSHSPKPGVELLSQPRGRHIQQPAPLVAMVRTINHRRDPPKVPGSHRARPGCPCV